MAQYKAIVMNRLFTFGCSFTSYNWSTWADILGTQATKFQNWGNLGAGNQYIFNSIFECDQQNQFTNDDTVLVCWTNIFREDRYINKWRFSGNLYTQQLYDAAWVKKFITERGCLIRDLAYIKAVKILLEQRQVNWKFLSMAPIEQTDQYKTTSRNPNVDVLTVYQDVIQVILPSFMEILKDRPRAEIDLHPLPADHLHYLDMVLPEFAIDLETRQKISAEDLQIRAPGYVIPEYYPPVIKRL